MSNPAQKKQMPAFLVLTIICLVAALALAGTNAITKGPIQEHAMAAQREAFGAVMSADEYIEMTIPEGSGISALVEAKQNGETIGYCVVASSGGYAGPVAVTLGVGVDGKVTGAKIGDTSFAETSGFGSRWLDAKNAEQFVGLDLKEGGAIEALSGATVTSTAVLNASNTALAAVNGILGIERTEPVLVFGVAEKKPVEQMALTGDIHEGSARGFASDVRVQLTMDANGAITGLAIESSGETPSFGTRCMEDPAFAEQFVGKTAPFAIGGNIDALAGATVTSTAVVNAVNAAVEAPANPDAVPFGSEAAEEEPAVEVSAQPVEGTLTAAAAGFAGADVGVNVTLNEDGTIATLTLDLSKQLPPVCDMCNGEAFLNQFIGKKGPFTDADIVAGATFTSEGVINALNSLFPAEEAPAEPAGEEMTGKAKGFQSEVTVTLTVDAGVITGIKVDSTGETKGIGTRCGEDEAFLAQFVGKKATPDLGEGIEALSGATVTSDAVVLAANAAIGVAVAEVEIPAEEAPAVETPVEEEPAIEEPVAPAVADVPAANALEVAMPAFGGQNITVTVTLDENGAVSALAVDATTQTPGLGLKCGEDEFVNQFIGKTGPFALGEDIDAVSYATITSQAVVDAVNSVIPTQDMSVTEEAVAAPLAATVAAFGGQNITVTVTLDETGAVSALAVDATTQTPGLGLKCAEDEFVNQFIGKTGPFALGEDIDAVSYATITSQAVVDAVNSVLPTQDMSVTEEAVAAPLAATVPAFGGQNITVTVTLDETGAVSALAVDASTQTPGLGLKCAEDEFVNQFIGKTGPFALGEDIDAVSYATITSQAVVDAVNALLAE